MKNLLFGLIATIVFGFAGNAQSLGDIGADKDLVKYLRAEYTFLKKCNNPELVKKINADGVVEESERSEFYSAFNTNENDYRAFISSQRALMNGLETKYSLSRFSAVELSEILEPELTIIYEPVIVTLGTTCASRYFAGLVVAAGGAYAGHMACMPAHATILGGLLCHAVVLAVQAAANHLILGEYEDCMAGR